MVKPLRKPRVATAEAPYHEEIEPGDSSGSEEATLDDPTSHIFSSQTASSLHRSHRYLSDAEAVRGRARQCLRALPVIFLLVGSLCQCFASTMAPFENLKARPETTKPVVVSGVGFRIILH